MVAFLARRRRFGRSIRGRRGVCIHRQVVVEGGSGKAGDLGGCLAQKLWREMEAEATKDRGRNSEVDNTAGKDSKAGWDGCSLDVALVVTEKVSSSGAARSAAADSFAARLFPMPLSRHSYESSICLAGTLCPGRFQSRQQRKSVFALDGAEILRREA